MEMTYPRIVEDGTSGLDELKRSVEFLKRKRAEYCAQ